MPIIVLSEQRWLTCIKDIFISVENLTGLNAPLRCLCLRVMLGRVLQPRQKGDTVKRAGGGRGCVWRCYKPAPHTKSLLCRGSPQVTHICIHTLARWITRPPTCRSLPATDFIQIKQHAKKIWAGAGENSEKKRHCRNKNQHKASILSYNVPLFPEAGWGGLGEKTARFRQYSSGSVNNSSAK